MCVRAIRLDDSEELTWRVLNEILGETDEPCVRRVSFAEIAKKLDRAEELIRYHVRKLVKTGYIKISMGGYSPTDKVIFVKNA